ncbi:MAG TPA: alpha/beta hydrolase [Trebonia sp.]
MDTQQITQYYELHGDHDSPPVLLIGGLGGVGAQWANQLERFSDRYYVILPDQRGTGRTTHAEDGYTTQQLAADLAALVAHLAVGPVHVVGASTGAAIGQYMALDHPHAVRSLTMAGAFARFDAFAHRGSEVRRAFVAAGDRRSRYSCYVCFLFSQRYTREHPDKVQAWIDEILANPEPPEDRAITLKRLDMIAAHDSLDRLGEIRQPSLIICGDHDIAVGLPLSEEIVTAMPGSELVVLSGAGHLIELEQEEEFFRIVDTFLDRH